jgi:hypothetical protein
MKIAGIVIGSILVVLALIGIPEDIALLKEKDLPYMVGRFSCLGCELVGGGLLLFFCIRGLNREAGN